MTDKKEKRNNPAYTFKVKPCSSLFLNCSNKEIQTWCCFCEKVCYTKKLSYLTSNVSLALSIMAITFYAAENPSGFRKQKFHIKFKITII